MVSGEVTKMANDLESNSEEEEMKMDDLEEIATEETDSGYTIREIVRTEGHAFIVQSEYLTTIEPKDILPGDIIRYTCPDGFWDYRHIDTVHPGFRAEGTAYHPNTRWGPVGCYIEFNNDSEVHLERVAPHIAEKLLTYYKGHSGNPPRDKATFK